MRRMISTVISAVLHLLLLIAFPSKMPSAVPSEGAIKKIPVLLLPSSGNPRSGAPLQPVTTETAKTKPPLPPSKPASVPARKVIIPQPKIAPSPNEPSMLEEAKIPKQEEEKLVEPPSPLVEEPSLGEEIVSTPPPSDVNGEAKEGGSPFASVEQKPEIDPKANMNVNPAGAEEWESYLAELRGRIETAHAYPEGARRRGQEGRVAVRVVVGADGRILSVELAEASPFPLLNRAAEQTIRSLSLPPLPPQLGERLEVTVPLVYHLKQSAKR